MTATSGNKKLAPFSKLQKVSFIISAGMFSISLVKLDIRSSNDFANG
jgi:hypothetical protein